MLASTEPLGNEPPVICEVVVSEGRPGERFQKVCEVEMGHCGIHGSYSDYDDSCPYCREAEEKNQAGLDEIAERLAEILERSESSEDRWNPGEFECPHCRYRTLKRNATRCPLCHGEPGAEYWARIERSEREKKERAQAAAVENQRLALERENRKAEALERRLPRGSWGRAIYEWHNSMDRQLHAKERVVFFAKLYFGYLLPIVILTPISSGLRIAADDRWKVVAAVVPGLNWGVAFVEVFRHPAPFLDVGVLLGPVLCFVIWCLTSRTQAIRFGVVIAAVVLLPTLLRLVGFLFPAEPRTGSGGGTVTVTAPVETPADNTRKTPDRVYLTRETPCADVTVAAGKTSPEYWFPADSGLRSDDVSSPVWMVINRHEVANKPGHGFIDVTKNGWRPGAVNYIFYRSFPDKGVHTRLCAIFNKK